MRSALRRIPRGNGGLRFANPPYALASVLSRLILTDHERLAIAFRNILQRRWGAAESAAQYSCNARLCLLLLYSSGSAMNDPGAVRETAIRETGLPVARELAEMLLTQRDLANSLASLKLWVESYVSEGEPEPSTLAVKGSLFRDGITQFVGCFDGKNAFPLVVETVFPNVEGIGPYFRWLRALRNSYTAHRHGSARQCVVGAIIDPTSGTYLGIGRMFAIYAGPSQEGHAGLLSIVGTAIRYVEARITFLENQFKAEAGAIAPGELLKLPFAAVQPQDPTGMAKSRGDVRRGIVPEHDERNLE